MSGRGCFVRLGSLWRFGDLVYRWRPLGPGRLEEGTVGHVMIFEALSKDSTRERERERHVLFYLSVLVYIIIHLSYPSVYIYIIIYTFF